MATGTRTVLEVISTGEYRDERLYLLKTIERLEGERREDAEAIGGLKTKLGKAIEDLNRLGGNVRGQTAAADGFSKRLLAVEVRAAYIATGAGAVVGIAIELGKWFLLHR